ncbi:hypothetical protein V5F34_00005, partial [Xanthobacter autotrophicus]
GSTGATGPTGSTGSTGHTCDTGHGGGKPRMSFAGGHSKCCDEQATAKLNSASAGFEGSVKSIVQKSGASLSAQDIASPNVASSSVANGDSRSLASGAPPNTGSTSGSVSPSFDNHHTPIMTHLKH